MVVRYPPPRPGRGNDQGKVLRKLLVSVSRYLDIVSARVESILDVLAAKGDRQFYHSLLIFAVSSSTFYSVAARVLAELFILPTFVPRKYDMSYF
jgi:hypothetical protein